MNNSDFQLAVRFEAERRQALLAEAELRWCVRQDRPAVRVWTALWLRRLADRLAPVVEPARPRSMT